MGNSLIEPKAFEFSKRMVDMYKYLRNIKKEYIISKQVFRSGTSICANIIEAEDGESRTDFKHKMNIALKEASETIYWIKLLRYGGYLNEAEYTSIYCDANELKSMLVAIVKKLKDEI